MHPRTLALPFAASALLLLTSCGGSPSGSSSVPTPTLPAATTIYVVQNNDTAATSSILEFSATATGSTAPVAQITPPSGVIFGVQALDAAGDLYVSGEQPKDEIFEYAPGATGAATPIRTITSLTAQPAALTVDASGQIYVIVGQAIAVYAANATANASPIRNITGNLTLLSYAYSIVVDSSGNIYVANGVGGTILVFSASANGNVAPTREIGGNLSGIGYPFGVTLDSAGNLYATTEASTVPGQNLSQVLEFAPGASGNVAPTRSLTAVSGYAIAGISLDGAGNIYVLTASVSQIAIQVFSASATGSTAPKQIITSSSWGGSDFGQVAVR